MSTVLFLIPLALFLGLLSLGAFLWSLKSGQFDDLEGAALRILLDDEMDNLEKKPNIEKQSNTKTEKKNADV